MTEEPDLGSFPRSGFLLFTYSEECVNLKIHFQSSAYEYYFRPRDCFDLSKDTLDIGNPISWKRAHFKKHFFKRVFAINDILIDEFYRRHLAYYLARHPEGNEEIFFKYLWELIESQLKVLMGKDVYDSNHLNNERQIERLKKFTGVLISHDRRNFHKSNEAVVANQELEIYALKQDIIRLKSELKKATTLEKDGYINIRAGRAHTLYDIIHKLYITEKLVLRHFW